MKLTITFIALLSVTTSWAEKEKKTEDAKDKREAPIGYPSSSHGYQPQGNDGASAISIGAGYSVGGAKPSYSSYEGQGYPGSHSLSSDGLPSSGHATIQLAPITLQPNHGNLIGADLNQLMSQLQQSLDSGALTLQAPGGYDGSYQPEAKSAYAGQEQSLQQFAYGAPKLQQYSISQQPQSSPPSYASGTKGLSSYSSTGPVLFNPSDAQITPTLNYAPSAGHSFGSSGGISLGSGGHSLAGLSGSFGGSHGASAQLLSSPYKSLGSSYAGSGKNTFKPSAYIGSSVLSDSSHGISALSGSYGTPSFGGASLSGSHGGISLGSGSHGGLSIGSGSSYGGHSLGSSSLGGPSLNGHSLDAGSFGGNSLSSGSFGGHSFSSGSHGGPSLGSGGLSGLSLSSGGHGSQGGLSLGSGGYGASFGGPHGGFGGGSSKYISNAYLPAKSEGFGSPSSYSSALSSPPGTSYGIPTATYGLPATATHAASSHSPQYYVSKSPSYSSFGAGSSSYRSPSSSHSSLKSYPKFTSGGYSSLSSSPKDSIQGAYSENSYNTIKYSQELKTSPQ